jgi:DNA-binding CsgD family transcriptional regulator
MQVLQHFGVDGGHARAVLTGGTLVRWYAIGLVGVVGFIGPPPQVTLLAGWIVGVAAYNSLLLWVSPSLLEPAPLLRLLVPLDTVSFFALIAIYAGKEPEQVYAIFVWVLLEAVLGAGLLALGMAFALYVACVVALQALRVTLFHLPMDRVEAVVWIMIMGVTAGCLVMVHRMLDRAAVPVPVPVAVPAATAPAPIAVTEAVRLTPREREVLDLLAHGCSNATIAARLHVSESTVKSHVDSLMARLQAHTRAEAVAVAARLNIL